MRRTRETFHIVITARRDMSEHNWTPQDGEGGWPDWFRACAYWMHLSQTTLHSMNGLPTSVDETSCPCTPVEGSAVQTGAAPQVPESD